MNFTEPILAVGYHGCKINAISAKSTESPRYQRVLACVLFLNLIFLTGAVPKGIHSSKIVDFLFAVCVRMFLSVLKK